ncbi:MAG: DUF5652 family protein [Candidatus Shapirobacteria bacterium]|nr:DUF5652 family protein [Candidatus Shapirobacteria bacterium]
MNNIISLLNQPQFYIPFLIWSIFWKGLALWKSASKRQLIWFVFLLTINTMGILEIVYVLFLNRWDIDNGRILNFLEKKIKKAKK